MNSSKIKSLLFLITVLILLYFVPTHNDNKQGILPDLQKESLLSSAQEGFTIEKTYLYDYAGGEGYGIVRRTYNSGEFVLAAEAIVPSGQSKCSVIISDRSGVIVEEFFLQQDNLSYFGDYHSKNNLMSYNNVNIRCEQDSGLVTILEGSFDGADQY